MVQLSDVEMTELDKRLQEMALLDFNMFCQTAGIDKQRAFVCFEIKKKRSYRQVGIKLRLSKSAVFAIAKKCPKS